MKMNKQIPMEESYSFNNLNNIIHEPLSKKAERILHECIRSDLPVCSKNVRIVLAMSSDLNVNFSDIAYIILEDPGMTLNFLKVGNSAFYSPGKQRVISMQNILVLLGIDNIVSNIMGFPQIKIEGFNKLSKKNPIFSLNLSLTAFKMKVGLEIAQMLSIDSQAIAACLSSIDIGFLLLSYNQPHIARFLFSLASKESVMLKTAKRLTGWSPHQLSLEIVRLWNFPILIRRCILASVDVRHEYNGTIEQLTVFINGWVKATILKKNLDSANLQIYYLEKIKDKTGIKYNKLSMILKNAIDKFKGNSPFFYNILDQYGFFKNLTI